MIAEYISYSCTRAEWETMRLLLELEMPIGLSTVSMEPDVCQKAYDELCEQGLLMPSGDSVVVDRLFAFLLTQACRADICLALRAQQRHLLLHRAPDLLLLSEWMPARCTLTPLPNLSSTHQPLLVGARRLSAPVDLELLVHWDVIDAAAAPTAEELPKALERLYNRFCTETLNNREA